MKELPSNFFEVAKKWQRKEAKLDECLKLVGLGQKAFYARLKKYGIKKEKLTFDELIQKIELDKKGGEQIKEYNDEIVDVKVYITSYGRIFTEFGQPYKPHSDTRRNKILQVCIAGKARDGTGYKIHHVSIARLVYKLFVDSKVPDNCFICYKDKNPLNLRADNLCLSMYHTNKKNKIMPQQNRELFESSQTLEYIRIKLWKYYGGDFRFLRYGMELEDLIQESLMMVWCGLYGFEVLEDQKKQK